MLENARRQTLLVIATLIAGLLCMIFMSPGWGMDLKGGNQLIYEVPEEALQKIVLGEHTTIDKVMDHTVQIVRDRIDPTGTLDALVTRRGNNGILIELPPREKDELDQIKNRISSLGRLEMRIVANDSFVQDNVTFDLKEEKRRLEAWLANGGKELVLDKWKYIERFNEDVTNGPKAVGNLKWVPHLIEPDLEHPNVWDHPYADQTQSNIDGVTPLADMTVAVFDRNTDFNRGMLTEAQQKLVEAKKKPFLLEFVAINWKENYFRGEDLDPNGVSSGYSNEGKRAVNYKVRDEKSGAYGDWSAKHIKKHSAIILNGVIRSCPYFVTKIPGSGQISGNFSQAEVDDLVKVLRTGSLQVEPEMLSDRGVGPTLGQKALDRGAVSLLAGTIAVFAFMLWYYKLAGVVACVTLLLNVFLLWAAVLFMQATITLPGLGGIVLTMGMAVDANVLIYERIREETERGKDILRAVRAGFERAMSAILDSNITTFLAGLVLYSIGVGPVRGFAVTLMVGIVTTVFTQFFVTRLLFHYLVESKRLKDFNVHRLLAQPKWNYFRYARQFFFGSMALNLAALIYGIAIVPSEVAYGIDFKGGANMQMELQLPSDAPTIRTRLAADPKFSKDFRYFQVNTVESDAAHRATLFNIRLKLNDEMRAQIGEERRLAREARKAAEAKGEEPPSPYVPPYVTQLKTIFGADLVKPAFSDPHVLDGPNNDAYADITLHLQTPVELSKLQETLVHAKLPGVKVSVPDEPTATQGKDLRVEWTTLPTTRASSLSETVRDALLDTKNVRDAKQRLTDVAGNAVKLSDPFPEAEEIQGRMVGELRTAAIGALILSWLLMIFYLRVRFHEYKYGIAAVVALLHDVLMAFGAVVLFNQLGVVHAEIDLNMIACFLTIIGYSVNDTIIVFDRIRENMAEDQKLGGHMPLREVINLSVNQTMSRTILTSGVTSFVVLAQLIVNWGTDSDLLSFAFGMLVGIATGTYSSIFIAGPIITWISDREAKKRPPTPAHAAAPVAAQ